MKLKMFLIILFCLVAVPAMAAWTVTAATCSGQPYPWENGAYMYCYQISVTSDAGASGDNALSDLLDTAYGAQEKDRLMRQLAGTVLYWVDYQPDGTDTPTSESTITIDKETTFLFFSEAVTTAATAQGWPGDVDTTLMVPLTDVTIAMTTLANTKKAIVKLWFLGGRK